MSKAFNIHPGKYHIPNLGTVDATKEVTNEKAFEIYKLSRKVFPWISLGPDAEAFLKKQKLSAQELAKMVTNARTAEEVALLGSLKKSKPLAGIVETKLKALKNNKQ